MAHTTPGGYHMHTVLGPFTAASKRHAEQLLSQLAPDAVRGGHGLSHPWRVDVNGKPVKELKRYVDYLHVSALQRRMEGASSPMRAQTEPLLLLLYQCEEFREAVVEPLAGYDAERILDPLARLIFERSVLELVLPLVGTLAGGEELAKRIRALESHPDIAKGC